MPAPASRSAELENSRLGVIFFLGNLRVDFSPEQSASELVDKGLETLKGKVGSGKVMSAANKVGGAVKGLETKVNEIEIAVQRWLVQKFNVDAGDAKLATGYFKTALPSLIYGIYGEVTATASDFKVTDMASGLLTGISKTVEYFDLRHMGKGVAMESGHPDLVASSIRRSVAKSALEGLAEAALAGAKVALAGLTAGVGLIINKVAGVIELILRFAVRFCDALDLRRIFADAQGKWATRGQADSIQKDPGEFTTWFKKTIDLAPVVAALVMNCGIAGDAMRFLQMTTGDGAVITQGQFDKGVTYLNGLKSAAGDLIMDVQDAMRIWSPDKMCASLLKHAGEIGLVQKESSSSWRAWIYSTTQQNTTKAKVLNWALDKLGYKQSTVFARI